MFDELYCPLPDREQYLRRIGYGVAPKTDRATLDGLIAAHLHTVPFENLDIYDARDEILLGTEALYRKIVERRRGGYCFELNALFMQLLQDLGFACQAMMARVMWNRDYLAPYGHRVTIVSLDGVRLYCDVGFGGPSPDQTLVLDNDGVQRAASDDFSFENRGDGNVVLYRVKEGERQPVLMLCDRPADPVDFVPLNAYFSSHRASYFKTKRMANIKTRRGSAAIDGDILRLRSDGHCEERPLVSASDLEDALRCHFGIAYSCTDVSVG